MRFGAQFWQFDWPGGPAGYATRLAESARILEEAGAASFWLMDHYFQMEGMYPAEDPMLEGYTSLGFLAGRTERARLGLMVTGVTYRHPGLLAKTVTTLDVLSGGRATLGIGAAWYEREHLGLGVPFPPLSERFERLDETLQIVRQMWSGEVAPFEGRHYHLAETLNHPLPLSQPRPPVLIGGVGEKKTFPLIARYGDACNFFPLPPADATAKLAALQRACDAEGRDFAEIEKTMLPPMGADDFVGALAPYREIGFETVVAQVNGDPLEWAEHFAAEVAPRLADL